MPGVARGQLVPTVEPAQCEIVDLAAELMQCTKEACQLDGEVRLACGKLTLAADHATVGLGPDASFAGAVAEGNVTVIDGRQVLTCTRLTLDRDRVRGRIDTARLALKRDGGEVSRARDRAVFRGDVEKTSPNTYVVHEGDFTLCDCSPAPPSWHLSASRIEATLDERATLYWPVFWLRPFGLFELPLPIVAPVSVPLQRRAAGLLPPRIAFLGDLPMLDVPLFLPLGESWDLALAPGTRLDWERKPGLGPAGWGAPRLWTRLRYAPSVALEGSIEVQWTHDTDHWAQALRLTPKGASARAHVDAIGEAAFAATPGYELVDRLDVRMAQRASLATDLDWTLDAQWLSDDLYLSDFSASLRDQASNYIPSRTQLYYRPGVLSASLAADHYVVLRNSADELSNVPRDGSAEAAVLHRGPHLRAHLAPVAMGLGAHVDADASFVRYGPWASDDALPGDAVGATNLGAAVLGLAWLGAAGPVNLAGRGALDALYWQSANEQSRSSSLLLRADADVRLARTYDRLTHEVVPQLRYRAIADQRGELPTLRAYDERLERRVFHQATVGVRQTLWTRDAARVAPLVELDLEQPFDLEEHTLLQSQAALRWSGPASTRGEARVSAAPGAPDPLRELTLSAALDRGPIALSSRYVRWRPDADRLRRTLYELAGSPTYVRPRGDGADGEWVHVLSGGLDVRWGARLVLSYATDLLLPTPATTRALRALDPSAKPRREFNEHVFGARYQSPCDCWGFALTAVFPRERPLEDRRVALTFTVGGYSLGKQ